MHPRLVPPLVLLGGAALLLLGVVALGRVARERLRDEPRYAVAFDDIDCPPPPGADRLALLHEVQYLARLPGRLPVLDDELPARLAEAFARHPWVEEVEEVRILLPDRVLVRPRFRAPALAVRVGDEVRVVDGGGVVLPAGAPPDDLPVFRTKAGPKGAAGRRWGDATVEAAAAVAALLRPHRERLRITEIEAGEDGLVLRSEGRRAVWGGAPGKEAPGEEPAARKIDRLLREADEEGKAHLDLRAAPGH